MRRPEVSSSDFATRFGDGEIGVVVEVVVGERNASSATRLSGSISDARVGVALSAIGREHAGGIGCDAAAFAADVAVKIWRVGWTCAGMENMEKGGRESCAGALAA